MTIEEPDERVDENMTIHLTLEEFRSQMNG